MEPGNTSMQRAGGIIKGSMEPGNTSMQRAGGDHKGQYGTR